MDLDEGLIFHLPQKQRAGSKAEIQTSRDQAGSGLFSPFWLYGIRKPRQGSHCWPLGPWSSWFRSIGPWSPPRTFIIRLYRSGSFATQKSGSIHILQMIEVPSCQVERYLVFACFTLASASHRELISRRKFEGHVLNQATLVLFIWNFLLLSVHLAALVSHLHHSSPISS